ncbi:MAG TPA: hypothetical protein VH061_11320 [Solirubrobacteraceae bacterium]|jgi:hypothetical protein|nr:hypothetical protein [Solirubrobacteraceae bacterium]
MRATPALVLALACLALTGCETTQEKSAKLERTHRKGAVASKGLTIAQANPDIKVLSATAVHTSEGTAVVVTVANSGSAQREIPLLVSVKQTGGSPISNSEAGLAHSLTSIAYVPSHGKAVWVDDQLTLIGKPGAATAKVGEGKKAKGSVPKVELGTHKLEKESDEEVVTGTVTNGSSVPQHELVVYATATQGSRTIAAGRAVITSLAAGAKSKFQIFLIGAPATSAHLTVSAPPSTF